MFPFSPSPRELIQCEEGERRHAKDRDMMRDMRKREAVLYLWRRKEVMQKGGEEGNNSKDALKGHNDHIIISLIICHI